jgi:hypothetical protein
MVMVAPPVVDLPPVEVVPPGAEVPPKPTEEPPDAVPPVALPPIALPPVTPPPVLPPVVNPPTPEVLFLAPPVEVDPPAAVLPPFGEEALPPLPPLVVVDGPDPDSALEQARLAALNKMAAKARFLIGEDSGELGRTITGIG